MATEKMTIIGVMHMKGTSKAGNEYDFKQLSYLTPQESVNRASMNKMAFGLESADIGITDEAFTTAAQQTFPLTTTVTIDSV